MALPYYRVEGDQIIERRVMESIPPHKAHLWRPEVIEGSGPIENKVVEADRVRVVRSHPPLAELKASFKFRIDDDAERCRLRFITPGAGMAMTYQEKFEQAKAVEQLGEEAAGALTSEQIAAEFPTLGASVGIEAQTLWACAQLVIARYEGFAALSGIIERARLAGKKAVTDAADVAGVEAAYQAVTWPSP